MPSIPQSLLWISLVVLWLFVLVPMLISKRDAVRRTSDVALATRVLNDSRARLLRRKAPAAGHASDPDWRPSAEDIDEDLDDDAEEAPARRSVVRVAAVGVEQDEDPGYLDVDVIDEASGALPVGASARAGTEAKSQTDELALDFGDRAERGARRRRSRRTRRTERESESELDGSDDEYEYVADSSGLEAPSDTELQLADSLSAARKRRYESKTAAAVSARKYKFRKRMLTVMAVLVVASVATAYTLTPMMWWVSAGDQRDDTALPGLSAASDAYRGAAAAPSGAADGPVAARGGEHRRQGVRRRAVTAAEAGFGGAGDRRRGSDLRAPGLRPVRASLRPSPRRGPVASPVFDRRAATGSLCYRYQGLWRSW